MQHKVLGVAYNLRQLCVKRNSDSGKKVSTSFLSCMLTTECLESTLGPASPIIDFNLFKIMPIKLILKIQPVVVATVLVRTCCMRL